MSRLEQSRQQSLLAGVRVQVDSVGGLPSPVQRGVRHQPADGHRVAVQREPGESGGGGEVRGRVRGEGSEREEEVGEEVKKVELAGGGDRESIYHLTFFWMQMHNSSDETK